MSAVNLLRPVIAPSAPLAGTVNLDIDNPVARVTRIVNAAETVTINLPPCDVRSIGAEFAFFVSTAAANITLNCAIGDGFVGIVVSDVVIPGGGLLGPIRTTSVVMSTGNNTRLVLGVPALGSQVTVVMASGSHWMIDGFVTGTASFSAGN